MPTTSVETLTLAEAHLAQVAGLYRAVQAAEREAGLDGDATALARENVRRLSTAFLALKKARLKPETRRLHERSHTERIALEQKWETALRQHDDLLFNSLDLDSAITTAQRGWITPPPDPESGVIAGEIPRLLAKMRLLWRVEKAKGEHVTTGAVTEEDIAKVEAWGGQRGAMGWLALNAKDPTHIRVLRAPNGDPLAVAAVDKENGVLHVRILAAQHGHGREMMQALAQEARTEGLGMQLVSTHGSEGFYRGLGMEQVPNSGNFGFTPDQVKTFASKAGFLPPPGVPATATGGATSASMVEQQLAFNVLQALAGPGKPITADTIREALVAGIDERAFEAGGVQAYLGLAVQTAEQSGQISLDHLGLNKTFAFANPRTMANDLYAVRGSKVIQNMYGDHLASLTKIIADATDPRNPKTVAEVKSVIREQWPRLREYQVARIARTETGALWMSTAANAYEANGISKFESIVATGPSIGVDTAGACDFCVEAATSVYDITDNLPPWHPNCRCDIIPITLDPESGESWLPPDEPWTGGGAGSGLPLVPPKPLPEPPPRAVDNLVALPPAAITPAPDVLPPVDPKMAVELKSQASRETINLAMQEVGRVHGVPADITQPHAIGSTRNYFAKDENAVYLNPRPMVGGEKDYLNEWSVIHEYGHFVQERRVISFDDAYGISEMAEKTPEFARFAEYDKNMDELFARAYQQYIAECTGQLDAMLANAERIDAGGAEKYWSVESFAPIRAEFDRAFQERGLLRGEKPPEPTPTPTPTPVPESGALTDGPAARALDDAYQGWHAERPTYEEAIAVNKWRTADGTKEIQGALRGTGEMTPEIQATIDNLDKAIAGAPSTPVPLDMSLFRGVDSKMFGTEGPRVGDIVHERGYTATTTEREVAEHYAEESAGGGARTIIEVQVPKGTDGIWMRARNEYKSDKPWDELTEQQKELLRFDGDEGNRELLLGRDHDIRVIEVTKDGQVTTVRVELLPKGAPASTKLPEEFPTPKWIEASTWSEQEFNNILRPYVGRDVRITDVGHNNARSVYEGKLGIDPDYGPTVENEYGTPITVGRGGGIEDIEVKGTDGEWHTVATKPGHERAPEPGPAPEPKQPSTTQKPALSGTTVKPSDRATIRTNDVALKKAINTGLDNIGDHVLLPEEAKPVTVVPGSGASSNFQPEGIARSRKWEGAKIRISTSRGDQAALDRLDSTYHEYGHYLDWTYGDDGWQGARYGTEMDADYKALMQAFHATPEYRQWADIYNGKFSTDLYTKGHARYMKSNIELFARGFAQYMGTVTEDSAYLAFVAEHAPLERGGWYWTPEHFAPIKEQFDALFEKKGILVPEAPAAPPPTHGTIGEYRQGTPSDPARLNWTAPETTDEPFGVTAHGLTNDEIFALSKYTGSGGYGSYIPVNQWLRGLKMTRGKPLTEIRAAVELLDSAITKAPALAQPLTLYRGVADAEHYGTPTVGQVIEDKAFMSTSTTPKLPTSWADKHGDVWTIQVPEGTKGINVNAALEGTSYGPLGIDPGTSKEMEVVLARGQRLVVDKVTERITTLPSGERIVAHDVEAHILSPGEEPKPTVTSDTPSPLPPPAAEAPAEESTTTTTLSPDHDLRSKEGLDAALRHYEGQTVRLTFDFNGYEKKVAGLVRSSSKGEYMLIGDGRIVSRVIPDIAGLEVKIGGRYKDFREVERGGGVEAVTPTPRGQGSGTRTGNGPVTPPPGGWTWPGQDVAPSGKIGVYPETPKFGSVEEATAWAEKYIARDVFLGSNPNLNGVQEALDAVAGVLRPYGVRLERFHVERITGSKALAFYTAGGTKKLTIGGVKRYFQGEMIQSSVQLFSKTKAAEVAKRTAAVFEGHNASKIAELERYIEAAPERHMEARIPEWEKQISVRKHATRWFMAQEDPTLATRSFMAHEAGHALSRNFGQELAGVPAGDEGLAKVFTARLELHAVTSEDRWAVSEYGAAGGNANQAPNSELWAECTAARICGQWDLIPENIRAAYEDTLGAITQADIDAKVAATAARDEAARLKEINKARSALLRARVGLH